MISLFKSCFNKNIPNVIWNSAVAMLFRVVGMRRTWQHRRLCVHAVVCTKHLAASFGIFCEFCVVFPREIFIGGHYKEAIIPSLNSFGKIVDFFLLSASNAAQNLTWRWHSDFGRNFYKNLLNPVKLVRFRFFFDYRVSRCDSIFHHFKLLYITVLTRKTAFVDVRNTYLSCLWSTSGCIARVVYKLDLSKFDGD